MDAVTASIDYARSLARSGIPIFLARPNGGTGTGYSLPKGWQHTAADTQVLERWTPGLAVCALMGHGLDLVDFDPRNGGTPDALRAALDGHMPEILAVTTTPSGGIHAFVPSMNVRSHDNILPGIDVKAGNSEGIGRGFAFLPPTVRLSKLTGLSATYRWATPPPAVPILLERLSGRAVAAGGGLVVPGGGEGLARLRALVESVHAATAPRPADAAPTLADLGTVGPWVDVSSTLRAGRNRGVFDLAAALRGRGGWRLEDAIVFMRETVWPKIDQSQGGHPFTEAEFDYTIRTAWERYADGIAQRTEEALDTAAERIPTTGVGLADALIVERVAEHLRDSYVWVKGLGWLEWSGRVWTPVDTSKVRDAVRRYLLWLYTSITTAGGADTETIRRLQGLLVGSKSSMLVDLVRGVQGIGADANEFDQQPDLLNCGNGVVDLRTGLIQPHDPALRFTKLTEVEYHPGAEHTDWKLALESLPATIIPWFQVRAGQGITGHMPPDDLLIVQQGGGENGKSTVMNGIRAALGDYYLLVPHRALLANADTHPTELTEFRGARFALLEETPEERQLSVTRLKMVVGTPEITARRIRQDEITFRATHSLFLSTNYLPVVNETDHGTWRRLVCVQYPYTFTSTPTRPNDRQGVVGLRERITGKDQAEAVLSWLIAGAQSWYANGFMPIPAEVGQSTRAWRGDSDVIVSYLDERIEFDANANIAVTDLYQDVREWLTARGLMPWSARTFNNRFESHGDVAYRVIRTTTRRRNERSARTTWAMPNSGVADDAPYKAWVGIRFKGGS